MAISTYVERYAHLKDSAFRWRYEASTAQKLGLALGMAAVTGLMAQVRVPLPFTPVPITLQVFAVLLSGVLLGARYGAVSQIMYLALGVFGVPWFQGWSGGLAYISQGVTVGYLVGFIGAALLIGGLTDRYVAMRGFRAQLVLMIAGVLIIDLAGTVYLASIMHKGLMTAFELGFLPFILIDMAKASAVAGISTALLPRIEYGSKVGDAARRER
jgi:biotin transport system substrate-specific component